MDKMLKNENGITLIALVVTIVVLLILAGISISLVIDQEGIIQKSKDARKGYETSKINEQEQMDDAEDWITEAVTGKVPLAKVPVGTKAKKNGTINGEEGNSNNPTIPKGYTPIDTDISKWGDGNAVPSQDAVNHGLVIKDDSNNEWVWIPVSSTTLATMYATSTKEEGETLCGETGRTTNKYSKTITIGTDSNVTRITRTIPGTTDVFREPDLIVGSDGIDYDAKEENYKTILGFDSKEKMAEAFVADYNEMIESISKYGGFYIGRYELSEAGVQKNKETLIKTNWYNLYKRCKELKASERVETRMIWGYQWDITLNWLISSGAKTSDEIIKESSSWGNYKGTSVKADDGITELKESGKSSIINTGVTTFTMVNNIYDLAGNCWEWTQEASYTTSRAVRGGGYNYGSSPASERGSDGLSGSSGNDSRRYSTNFNNKVTSE